MATGTQVIVVVSVGLFAGAVAYAMGRGEEQLDADFWRQRHDQIRGEAARTVAATCARANPRTRKPRGARRG